MRVTHTCLHQEKNEDLELQKLVLPCGNVISEEQGGSSRTVFSSSQVINQASGQRPVEEAAAEFTVVLRTQLDCDNTGTCDVRGKYVFRKIFSKIIVLDLLLLSPSSSPLSPDSLSSHQGFFFNLPRHRMGVWPLRLAECFSNQTRSFLALAISETELLCFQKS